MMEDVSLTPVEMYNMQKAIEELIVEVRVVSQEPIWPLKHKTRNLVLQTQNARTCKVVNKLSNWSDFNPFTSSRKNQQKMLADQYDEIEQLEKEGKFGAAKFRRAMLYLLWIKYFLPSIHSIISSFKGI